MIKYLKHSEINQEKWDDCIESANTGLPYPYSWTLNVVTSNKWDGLVLNDYEAVMPLPWNRKKLVKQVYQPYGLQQLGVFGSRGVSIDDFVKKAFKSFSIFHQRFNYTNAEIAGLATEVRTNYKLSLNHSYKTLFDNYSHGRKSDLKLALKSELEIAQVSMDVAWKVYNDLSQPNENLKTVKIFHRLLMAMNERGKCMAIIAKDKKNPIAVNIFYKGELRIINLISVSNTDGRSRGATTAILDQVVQQNAESETFLDFEGSMIPGVATFFKSFGAKREIYWSVKKGLI